MGARAQLAPLRDRHVADFENAVIALSRAKVSLDAIEKLAGFGLYASENVRLTHPLTGASFNLLTEAGTVAEAMQPYQAIAAAIRLAAKIALSPPRLNWHLLSARPAKPA